MKAENQRTYWLELACEYGFIYRCQETGEIWISPLWHPDVEGPAPEMKFTWKTL